MGDYAALQREVVKRVGVSAGQIVLDGGTGPEASFAVRLAEAVGEGLMIAIDFNKNYIPQIKKSILRADSRIVFLLSDLTWIPLQSNSVDIATSLDAIQNMFSKDVVQKVILEMKRVVKPQGKTAIGSRLPVARNRAQETYLKLHNFEYELERIMLGEEQRFYNENELIRMFQNAGFKKISTEVIEWRVKYSKESLKKQLERLNNYINGIESSELRSTLIIKYNQLKKEALTYGEEFPPTVFVIGRVGKEGILNFNRA